MKKRILLIASAFLAMAAIPLFSSHDILQVSAADDAGVVSVGGKERTFTDGGSLVSQMKDIMTKDLKSDYNNKDVVLTLYKDVTANDFLPKSPSDGNLWHNSVTINLNGHTLKVTGARQHELGSLVIEGGGGKIDFSSTDYGDPIFYFKSSTGGKEFNIRNTTFANMKAEELFYINECSDTISAINIENCFFNNGSFSQEGGILYLDDSNLKNVNITNCCFYNLSNSDYASCIYVDNNKLENLNIKGTTFYSCGSNTDGGAIYINQDKVYVGNSSTATFDKNFVYNCYSNNDYGGGIFVDNCYDIIQNFTFYGCSAYDGGGGVCLYNDTNQILNCAFYDNVTDYYGGAIYVADHSCAIKNSIICYNTSKNRGNESGREIYCTNLCSMEGNTIYYYADYKTYNCGGLTDEQKDTHDPLLFTDSKNYSGTTLIRGNSQSNPILINNIHDMFVLYFNLRWDATSYGGVYSTKHYLLTTPLPGFMGFYKNLKEFTGTFNFGGNFLKFAVNWDWPGNHTINPQVIDLSSTDVQKDGHIRMNVNNQWAYYRPVCNLNANISKLTSDNYFFFDNTTIEERLVIDGDVTILINGGFTLTCNDGINVSSGNKLTLIGWSSTNKSRLNATAINASGAGIGGGYGCTEEDTKNNIPKYSGESMGTVSAQYMIINAKGSKGAGIGGGAGMDGHVSGSAAEYGKPGGDGGKLIVTDSEITAIGDDGRDIGGGNGGDGANIPSNGGKGTEITMNSGTITATTNGIGGGHAGKYGSYGYGSYSISFGTTNGGPGGKIDFKNGKIIAKGLCGGTGAPNGGTDGSAATLVVQDNCGVSYGSSLDKMSKTQKYNPALDPNFKDNYVKILIAVRYTYNLAAHTCEAFYTLNGQTHSIIVNTTHVVDVAATCTTNEIAHEHAVFEDKNVEPDDSESAAVDNTALGHSYGGEVEYTRDGMKVTASWHCQRTGCDSIQTESAELKYFTDTEATCTTNETGHLEAEFTKGFPTYKTEPNSEVKQNSFKGHKLSGETTYVWSGDSCTATAYCITCKENVSETVKGTFVQDIPENCVNPEKGHYHADFKYNFASTDSPEGMTIGPTPAYGHNFDNTVVYEWNTETYECTATVMCKNKDCDEIFTETVQGVAVYDIQPTCVDNAIGHYVATFTKLPGIFKTQMTQYAGLEIPNSALGHNFEGKITYYWDTQTNKCTASWHCSRCSEVESETVDGTFFQDSPATCEENIKGHCTAIFKNEHFNTGQSTEPNSVEIPDTALGHQFGGPISYEWDEQTLQWTGYQACQREGCEGVYSETCDGTFVQIVAPTCLDDAKGYYVSNFKTEGFEQQTTTKKDYSCAGTALGHKFGGDVTYKWNDDTHECTATWGCVREGCHSTQSQTVQGVYVRDTDPTCLTNEFGHFEAHFTIEGFETQSTEKNSFEVLYSALGHEFGGTVTYTWDETTHECTASWSCRHGGCAERETETVQGVYVKDSDATCLENEKGHYEATFTNSYFTKQSSEQVEVPDTALGHDYNITYTWNADCTQCTATRTCSRGDVVETIDATVTFEYGYSIAKFEDARYKTQSVKTPAKEKQVTDEEKNETLFTYIFVGSCIGVTLIAAIMIIVCIKRKVF